MMAWNFDLLQGSDVFSVISACFKMNMCDTRCVAMNSSVLNA